MRIVRALSVIGTAAALAACGTGTGSPESTNAVVPLAGPPGSLQSQVTYPGASVVLAPPPAGAAPAVTAQQAWQTYVRSGLFPDVARQTRSGPDIQLADFSDNVQGQIQPDGTVQLDYQHVLAWTITFSNVPYAGIGVPAQARGRDAVPEDIVVAVDANTGQILESFADQRQ